MKLAKYIKNFLNLFWNSLTAPRFYLEVLNRPLSFSWRFFLISFVLLSFIATSFFVLFDIPSWQSHTNKIAQQIQQDYQSNLSFQWDNHNLATQPNKSLVVPYPKDLPSLTNTNQLALIDTQVSDVHEALAANKTDSLEPLTVITSNKIFVSDLSGNWSALNLSDSPFFENPWTLNKQNLPAVISQAKNQINHLFVLAEFVYPFAFMLLTTLTTLFTIAIDSLLVFYIIKLFRRGFPYRKVFQLSLHVAIIAELVQLVTQRIDTVNQFTNATQFNMFTLTYWAYMMIILWTLRSVKMVQINLQKT